MKKGFWVLLNKVFKKDLELLYGIGTTVEINDIIFSTNKKTTIISCKLYIGDIYLFESVGQSGLNYLFEEAMKCMGFYDEKFILQISFDLTHSDNLPNIN
jgi:hypothetical protein